MESIALDSTWQRIEAAKLETQSAQARRLVDYLHHFGPTLTGDLCQATAIQNLSAAANQIRGPLQRRGLAIIAERPRPLIKNRFGEVSQSHVWRLQAIR